VTNFLQRAAEKVLEQFPLAAPIRQVFLGNAGGFSGARLWRIHAGPNTWCLKAWPRGRISAEELNTIHEWMKVARNADLGFVPSVFLTRDRRSFAAYAVRLWDLTEWLPGNANFHAYPSRARLVAASHALAKLHHLWSRCESRLFVPSSITRRLESAAEWRTLIESGWQPDFANPALAALADIAHEAWVALPALGAPIQQELSDWNRPMMVQPCLCDIWHDHVLFDGERVSGIIDYGAMRLDQRAADLARMFGSLAGDNAEAWASALDAYRSIIPLASYEVELISVLDRTGTILAAANWLRWLYHEGRHYDDLAAVRRRMLSAVARMKRWNSARQAIILS